MILITVGIAGILAPNFKQLTNVDNISYRYLNLERHISRVGEETFIAEPPPVFESKTESQGEEIQYLNIGTSYIHAKVDKKMEHPSIPTRILIPSISLEAPVISAEYAQQKVGNDYFDLWEAPDHFAAGWHPDSALLGEKGNTVINGHHNTNGMVFQDLVKIQVGDRIIVFVGDTEFTFIVNNTMILPELYVDVETRLANARWLGKSDDERLTLVTCWPADSNTHRLIVVAVPLQVD